MKYIVMDEVNIYHFDDYFKYIESIKNDIDPAVYGFASNKTRYSLSDAESLHDSWVEEIKIIENSERNQTGTRSVNAIMKLLGSYHDRHFIIEYKNVASYSIAAVGLVQANRGHGDLLIHELRLNQDKLIEHELLFANGSSIIITCSSLKCVTEHINKKGSIV